MAPQRFGRQILPILNARWRRLAITVPGSTVAPGLLPRRHRRQKGSPLGVTDSSLSPAPPSPSGPAAMLYSHSVHHPPPAASPVAVLVPHQIGFPSPSSSDG